MSKIPPMKSTSCSGADQLQIQRSHCTNAAEGDGNASRLGRGAAAPARYPTISGVSRTASSHQNCALRPTNFKPWMTPATEPARTRERYCRAPETTSCRKSVMSANDGLAGVKRAFLGPSRLTECTCSGPGNPLAAVGVQVLATRSPWSCASLRRCSSRARASSCSSCCMLVAVLRVGKGFVESKEGLLHRTLTFHLQSHWLSGLCSESLWAAREAAWRRASWSRSRRWQGLARNGPLEGARAVWACCFWRIHLQKVPPLQPRRWAELHDVNQKKGSDSGPSQVPLWRSAGAAGLYQWVVYPLSGPRSTPVAC